MATFDDQAIQAALSGNWSEAIRLNKVILQSSENNLDALNRLAYALSKCGKYNEACKIYQIVLKHDSYNPLALKNLEKCKQLKNDRLPKSTAPQYKPNTPISPSLFLSNAQKTKSVQLINSAPRRALQAVSSGEEIFPLARRFEVRIMDKNETFLGTLPDDIGHPLLKTVKKGVFPCRFYVKDVRNSVLTVFIKY